jgi:hypothetical protein
MKSEDEIRSLEKLIVQLQGLHAEITLLAKKSPNDGLNLFKLKLVNKVLTRGNEILMGRYKPFEDFNIFDEDALPTNSDVTMILALYMEQAERFRSDNMIHSDYKWWYVINGEASKIDGRPPTKIGVVEK